MIQDGPGVVDSNLDGVINASEDLGRRADTYAEQLATQLRKGFLAYCVLLICGESAKYTSDIILQLRGAELVVVEGTIYPLLSRLQKDGLLAHEWQESEQGPPRKYYKLTDFGRDVVARLGGHIKTLNSTLDKLEKGAKS
jgi:PadR family transcriptional regulator PadR